MPGWIGLAHACHATPATILHIRAIPDDYIGARRSALLMAISILRYVHLYNSQLPQAALKCRTPIAALEEWQRQRPELVGNLVYNHA
jgi:hypothetical protein